MLKDLQLMRNRLVLDTRRFRVQGGSSFHYFTISSITVIDKGTDGNWKKCQRSRLNPLSIDNNRAPWDVYPEEKTGVARASASSSVPSSFNDRLAYCALFSPQRPSIPSTSLPPELRGFLLPESCDVTDGLPWDFETI